MDSGSDDEGSSFFGGNADEDESDDEEDVSQPEAVFSAQHAERAARNPRAAPPADFAPAASETEGQPAHPTTSSAAAALGAKPSGAKASAFRFPGATKARAAAGELSPQLTASSGHTRQPRAASAAHMPKQPAHGGLQPAEMPSVNAPDAAKRNVVGDDQQWDAETETDSDDDYASGQAGSPDFMSQYAAAMEAELGSSNIGNTFARVPQASINTSNGTGSSHLIA